MRVLKEYSLSPEQWQILATLWTKNSLSQKEIYHLTMQDAPSVSKMITKMKKNKLVLVATSTQDKRKTEIRLTKTGASLKNVLPKKILAHFDQFLKDISPNQKTELLKYLKNLRKVFGDEC